jgi:parallel beta-helix repeat protein
MSKKGIVSLLIASFLSVAFLPLGAVDGASAGIVPPYAEPTFPTTPHDPISIYYDYNLEVGVNGVTRGSGTVDNPFVIEGWEIQGGGIEIFLTTAYVVVRNNYIHSSYYGIWLQSSTNVEISGNVVCDCASGIQIWTSSKITVDDNLIFGNGELGGVAISSSVEVTFSANMLYDDGLYIVGWTEEDYCSHIITADNTVNGKSLLYFNGMDGLSIKGQSVGELIVVNSRNVWISDLEISDTDVGIQLAYVVGAAIKDCTISRTTLGGMNLEQVTFALVVDCSFEGNEFSGVTFWECSYSAAIDNEFRNNYYGVALWLSDNVAASRNEFVSNEIAITVDSSSNVLVSKNHISEGEYYGVLVNSNYWESSSVVVADNFVSRTWIGIFLNGVSNIVVKGNTVFLSDFGIDIARSTAVLVYHNNFVRNDVQASVEGEGNAIAWDNGYPGGGNFWSNCDGVDRFSGPMQDVRGADGIGDTPYLIDSANLDSYPLIRRG